MRLWSFATGRQRYRRDRQDPEKRAAMLRQCIVPLEPVLAATPSAHGAFCSYPGCPELAIAFQSVGQRKWQICAKHTRSGWEPELLQLVDRPAIRGGTRAVR
ncbi:MAG: hypothetical protein A2V88_00765 [Elusimicrobia bacterium RBG_16_66_12]|nr:MAG: hypothetical protein A2V88_00765 [Elusimicrobia bacterium RBG_16_66_12]